MELTSAAGRVFRELPEGIAGDEAGADGFASLVVARIPNVARSARLKVDEKEN